jgi:hypothetical protein
MHQTNASHRFAQASGHSPARQYFSRQIRGHSISNSEEWRER